MKWFVIVRLVVPPEFLVDSCAGGTWSEDLELAVWFGDRKEAIEAVLAAELEAGAELGQTWDVIELEAAKQWLGTEIPTLE